MSKHPLEDVIVEALRFLAADHARSALLVTGAGSKFLQRSRFASDTADLITQYGLEEVVNVELQT